MKKMLTTVLVIALVAIVGVKAYSDNNKHAEWEATRGVINVTVPIDSGYGIDHYGYQYKPDWMDVREYRYEVMELNNMTSAELHGGQSLQLYVCCEHYTVDAICLDDGYTIITADGNEWKCDTDVVGCAEVTFSDNGTTDNIDDDAIVSIREVSK